MLPSLSIRQVPILRLAILMIIGMTMVRLGFSEIDITTILGTIVIVIALLTIQHFANSGAFRSYCLNATTLLLGALLLQVHILNTTSASSQDSDFLKSAQVKLFEVEEFSENDNYVTLYGKNIRTLPDDITPEIDAVIRVKKPSTLGKVERGDIIATSAKLSKVVSKPLPNGFDYGQYLLDRGYTHQAFITKDVIRKSNQRIIPRWKYIRYDLRNKSLSVIDTYLSGSANKITKALVLGDRSGLDAETRTKYANSGVIHILAVSGLHVGIIAFILFQFIDKVLWQFKTYAWGKSLFTIMGLIAFAEISGGSPTVWRAVIMSSIFLISKSLNRNSHALNLLGIAAILILVFKPTDLFSVSFQLSFSAVGGILLFAPWFFKLYDPQGWFSKRAWAIIVLGICAQIGTLPLTIYYFHQLPLLSPIAGLIAIPVAFGTLSLGGAMLILSTFWHTGAEFISYMISFIIAGLNLTVDFINQLPISLIKNIWIQPIEALLVGSSIIMIALWLYIQKNVFYKFALATIGSLFLFHTISTERQYITPQKIVYSTSPLAMDIILEGTCYHYNEDYKKKINEYLSSDIRAKYKTKEVIEVNSSFLSTVFNN